MTGIDRYVDKDRLRARRKNHIAKDLRTPKYGQRVVQTRHKKSPPWDDQDEDYDEQ